MRSTRFRLSTFLVPLVVLSGVALGVGCGSADVSSAFDGSRGASPEDGDPNVGGGDGTTFGASDAAAPTTHPFRGSPLCRATSSTCMPDDDGTRQNTYEIKCADMPDGGYPDGGSVKSCRVEREGSALAPTCKAEADPKGTDGVTCANGSDCAPGFDCVDNVDKKVCRRYCCTGSCGTAVAQNGGKTFCDVQKVVSTGPGAAPFNAPVCMPLKSCKLLTQGQCKEGETCAIVTEKGETGCVANGTAAVGKSCDEEHCNPNLTCLGQPGSRTCYALCRLDGTAAPCGPTQFCSTSALFADKDYGVCKDAAQAK